MTNETLKEFKTYLWKKWLLDVLIRTIKTGVETFAGFITIDAVVSLSDIDWIRALSVSAVAMIYTVLMNVNKIITDIEKANDMEVHDENLGSGDKRGDV